MSVLDLYYSASLERARSVKPFLWQIQLDAKNGRDFILEEAREFHYSVKIEFDRMIKMMNRDQKARELYYSFLSEHWGTHLTIRNHHTFTRKLCKELSATRVIQKAFRWYRYNPEEKFCKRIQFRGLCDLYPDINFDEEIQKFYS